MSHIKCPQCDWKVLAVEKRPDGNASCQRQGCGWHGKYSMCFERSSGITWHKPVEKMPEVGDEIVVYYKEDGVDLGFKLTPMLFNDVSYLGNKDYWAHASSFNFPENKE